MAKHKKKKLQAGGEFIEDFSVRRPKAADVPKIDERETAIDKGFLANTDVGKFLENKLGKFSRETGVGRAATDIGAAAFTLSPVGLAANTLSQAFTGRQLLGEQGIVPFKARTGVGEVGQKLQNTFGQVQQGAGAALLPAPLQAATLATRALTEAPTEQPEGLLPAETTKLLGTLGGAAGGGGLQKLLTQAQGQGVEGLDLNKLLAQFGQQGQQTGINPQDPTPLQAAPEADLVETPGTLFAKGGKMMKKGGKYRGGGRIEGAGTGTSDSIATNLQTGSFVVPAKNAGKAELLREMIFGNGRQKAKVKGRKGEAVKISDGEQVFTPQETVALENIGINLNSLAPQAQNGTGFQKGGEVDLTKMQLLDTSEKKRGKKTITENIFIDPEGNRFLETIIDSAGKKKTFINDLQRESPLSAGIKAGSFGIGTGLLGLLGGRGQRDAALGAGLGTIGGGAALISALPERLQTKRVSKTVERKAKGGKISMQTGGSVDPLAPIQPTLDLPPPEELPPLDLVEGPGGVFGLPPLSEGTETAQQLDKKNKSVKLPELNLENIDLASLFGFFQTGLGAERLRKQGERPRDVLPPDLPRGFVSPGINVDVQRAQREAQFGLNFAQRTQARRGIESGRKADVKNILNLTGGSAAQSLANIGGATERANRALLNVAVQDEQLKQAKQRTASTLLRDADTRRQRLTLLDRQEALLRSRISRQLFLDDLRAFEQEQKASGKLLGAGIQNVVGAQRLSQTRKFLAENG